MKPRSVQSFEPPPLARLAVAGYSLTETMVAASIFVIAIAALLATQLGALKMNAYVRPKVDNARNARQTLGPMVEEIRCANSILVGTGTVSAFRAAGTTNFQGGNALRVYTSTNLSQYIYYYTDTNTAQLKKVLLGSSNTVVIAAGVTNRVLFTMEDFSGTVLTNSQNNAVLSVLLQFRRGWAMNGVSDSYQIRAKITRRSIL